MWRNVKAYSLTLTRKRYTAVFAKRHGRNQRADRHADHATSIIHLHCSSNGTHLALALAMRAKIINIIIRVTACGPVMLVRSS